MSPADILAHHFRAQPHGAAAVYLFGSQARGTARADSDVDVGVLFDVPPERTLMGMPFALADDLSALVGKRVDLVVLNHAPPDLVHRVLRDGELIYEGSRSARVRFEVQARNEYFDMLPIWAEYRRAGRP